MKTLSILTVLAAAAVAVAAPAAAQETLPVTYVVHKLAADGLEIRSLEPEDGIYEARVVATDGTIVKVGVDPQTAELTDAYSHAKARRDRGPAPKVDAAHAIMAAAATGYWDVREVEYEHGRWEVDARDDRGHSRKLIVDAVTGKVD